MLCQLSISNYALIEHLEISPSANFNVVTGETGAGKSIVLGAVGLMMGNRADSKVLYDDHKKCIVEGVFDVRALELHSFFEENDLVYEDECIIRRVIAPTGKSRAFINDEPVTLDVLKRLTKRLLDVHSQHDNLLLSNSGFQLNIVDTHAESQPLKKIYSDAYSHYSATLKIYEKLKDEADSIRKEQDFHQFQFDELSKANLIDGEETTLKEELLTLENTEDIKLKLNESSHLLEDSEQSIIDQLNQVAGNLTSLSGIASQYQSVSERINGNLVDLKDIAYEIQGMQSSLEYDPVEINTKKERLDLILQLLHKHGVETVAELLHIQEVLDEKIQAALSLDEDLSDQKNKVDAAYEQLKIAAHDLTKKREASFAVIARKISMLIRDLGMPEGVFDIKNDLTDFGPTGQDKINFLFSANKGIAPQPIGKVASGGEFSRLMFSLKFLQAEKATLPTLIFDEIETGISGEVAFKMLEMIQEIAKKYQIFSISHLPQFAAKGDHHYFVFKDHSAEKSVSKIKKLNEDERVTEIAKMIGGASPSEVAINNAKELLVNQA